MDLWIMSQNNDGLTKVNKNIGLKYNDHKTIIADYIPDFSDKYDGSYDILGTYESEKRALEILQEIKRHIAFLNVEMGAGRFGELDFESDVIFEMPEK